MLSPSSLFAVNETQGVTKQTPVRLLISRSEANPLSGHLEVKTQPSGLQCVNLWWRRFEDTADQRKDRECCWAHETILLTLPKVLFRDTLRMAHG